MDSDRQDYYLTLSKLAFAKKNFSEAKKLIDVVKDIPIKKKEDRDKFFVYLSSVSEKNGDFDTAIQILENYHNASESKGDKDQIYILSRLFHLYKGKGLSDKAIDTGKKLLADYAGKYKLDKERYDLGELYLQNDNRDAAQKVWKDLDKNSLWKKMAKNKLESESWKQSAENSMGRIPAMAK